MLTANDLVNFLMEHDQREVIVLTEDGYAQIENMAWDPMHLGYNNTEEPCIVLDIRSEWYREREQS